MALCSVPLVCVALARWSGKLSFTGGQKDSLKATAKELLMTRGSYWPLDVTPAARQAQSPSEVNGQAKREAQPIRATVGDPTKQPARTFIHASLAR